jgi:hypothetical protein
LKQTQNQIDGTCYIFTFQGWSALSIKYFRETLSMISVAELFQICVTAKGSVNTWGTTYCCELDVGHMCKVESPSSLDEKTFNIVLVLMARVGISTVQF